jgi:hypothetical protein
MKKILSVLTTLLLLASCSQEELGTPFYAGQEVSISAALSSSKNNDGKKRISGKDNVDRIDLTWDEGDEILVTVGDQSAVFTLSSGAGTNNAIFSGTMPADGASYSVQYPTFVPDLTEQRYVENGFGKDLMLMTTKEERTIDGGFALSADYALLGLQLTGDQQIGKIVVTNIAENKTYTLHSINVMLSAEPTLFYIVVPEGEGTIYIVVLIPHPVNQFILGAEVDGIVFLPGLCGFVNAGETRYRVEPLTHVG